MKSTEQALAEATAHILSDVDSRLLLFEQKMAAASSDAAATAISEAKSTAQTIAQESLKLITQMVKTQTGIINNEIKKKLHEAAQTLLTNAEQIAREHAVQHAKKTAKDTSTMLIESFNTKIMQQVEECHAKYTNEIERTLEANMKSVESAIAAAHSSFAKTHEMIERAGEIMKAYAEGFGENVNMDIATM